MVEDTPTPEKQTLGEKVEEAKLTAKLQLNALIQSAKDPTGTKALIDKVWADIMKTAEFEEAIKTGKPIDLVEAERITTEIDEFIAQSNKVPGLGKYGFGFALSSVQRKMHQYMSDLRKKAQTQGVIEHPIPTVATSQGAEATKVEIPPAASAPQNFDDLEEELKHMGNLSHNLYGDRDTDKK